MKTLLFIGMLFGFLTLNAQPGGLLPADPQASPEAVGLFQRLMKLQEKGVMYGHQDDLMYGYTWWYEKDRSDIKDLTGDYPAVAGFELGHLELGKDRSLDSVSFAQIREQIGIFHKRNGIISISWHPDNPLTGKSAWDVSSREVVKSILPNGANHAKFNTWMDRLADYFLTLKDDNGVLIPFIFRPWHEHSGSFFWWGKTICTEDEYLQLWQYTVNYLRKKGLHNILYAYNTDRVLSLEEYLEGYPGDELIDMLSLDMYDRGPAYFGELDNALEFISKTAQARNKLCALSECGGSGNTWFSESLLNVLKKYPVSYVLNWRNAYSPHAVPENTPYSAPSGKNEKLKADFLKFYHDPHTLFLKDIQE
jgi:mannan endo-1,4-beta-mannosidase